MNTKRFYILGAFRHCECFCIRNGYRRKIPTTNEKCKNGDNQSCLKYADYYANGKGVVQNFSIAQEQFASLCRSGNAKACAGLEDSYAKQLNIEHIYKKV